MVKDWLWDKRITIARARVILRDPAHPRFIALSSTLLSRKNNPNEVFRRYIKPEIFCRQWPGIKSRMKKDNWNSSRTEFWQAVYEKLLLKYRAQGTPIFARPLKKDINAFCSEVGEKVRGLRKQKGYTQRTFSEKLKVSQQMISRIESGGENISILTLKKILKELGATLSIEET
ncbi:MAG: helix-turn-helix transcriptional regulator [Candidatus Omnitrophota bacterium]